MRWQVFAVAALSALALTPAVAQDDGKTEEKTQESERHRRHRHRRSEPVIGFQFGRYEPRDTQINPRLNRYTVTRSDEDGDELFGEYLTSDGGPRQNIYGVGYQWSVIGGGRRGAVSPFVGLGWGLYHQEVAGSNGKTLVAGKFRLGVETRAGATAEISILDGKFKNGMRGSSVSVGWRF